MVRGECPRSGVRGERLTLLLAHRAVAVIARIVVVLAATLDPLGALLEGSRWAVPKL